MRIAFLFVLLTLAMWLGGCAHGISYTPPASHPLVQHTTPASLTSVAHGLDGLIITSILFVGVAVAVYFLAPVGHGCSFALGAGSLAVLSLSLALRVTLWVIPWIIYGGGALALLALAVEIYLKVADRKAPQSLQSAGAAVSAAASAVEQSVSSAVAKL